MLNKGGWSNHKASGQLQLFWQLDNIQDKSDTEILRRIEIAKTVNGKCLSL